MLKVVRVKRISVKVVSVLGILLVLFWILSFPKNTEISFGGNTMGTTYTVKAWGKIAADTNSIKVAVDDRLKSINHYASTWLKDSEITKFNTAQSTEWIRVSPFLAKMVALGKNISEKSMGAFDITLSPLIDIWGFDAEGRVIKHPAQNDIKRILSQIGNDTIHVNTDVPALKKQSPKTRINLSAIAKGGGVDEIGTLLETFGLKNYLVEIGGEIRAKGSKVNGKPWIVGIETPVADRREIQQRIPLRTLSLATSGDYRNYFESDGKRYSHIINPKTGWPVGHKVASVSVLANSTAEADGWATALFVLGVDKGLEIANTLNIATLFLVRRQGVFVTVTNKKWDILTGRPTQEK